MPAPSRLRDAERLAAPDSSIRTFAASTSVNLYVTVLPLRDCLKLDCDFLCLSLPTTTTPFMNVWCGMQM